jgi:hypothetical protein
MPANGFLSLRVNIALVSVQPLAYEMKTFHESRNENGAGELALWPTNSVNIVVISHIL